MLFISDFASTNLHFHNCFSVPCSGVVAAKEWSFRLKERDVSIETSVSICPA